jgi:hypothetical protein
MNLLYETDFFAFLDPENQPGFAEDFEAEMQAMKLKPTLERQAYEQATESSNS